MLDGAPATTCLRTLLCHLVSLTAFLLQLSFLPTLIPCLLAVLPGSSHLQLGMSDEPLHGQGFFGTYPGKYLWAAKCPLPACTQCWALVHAVQYAASAQEYIKLQ